MDRTHFCLAKGRSAFYRVSRCALVDIEAFKKYGIPGILRFYLVDDPKEKAFILKVRALLAINALSGHPLIGITPFFLSFTGHGIR
jgi:hypothetical protein